MSDILSAISAVASAVAAVSASVAIWPAHRAATEACKQNNIQTKVQKEALQPYLWVDIQPTFAQGNLLQIVLANEGPTVATNVQVVFDPKIPPATAGLDKSEVAQCGLRDGILSLTPGRRLRWPIGSVTARIGDSQSFDSTITYRVTVKGCGPLGPLDSGTFYIRPADWREIIDEPVGSPHRVAEQFKEIAKQLNKLSGQ